MKKFILLVTALCILSGCAGLKQAHQRTDQQLAQMQADATELYEAVKKGAELRSDRINEIMPVDDFKVIVRPNELSLTPGVYVGIKFTF